MTNRTTHAYDGPLALFLIGVRIHQPWRVGVVGQVIRAMPPMIAELERNKAAAARGEEESLGYLGSRSTVDLTGTTMIQWWRSTDDIYAYASRTDHRHREAWLEFYRKAEDAPRALTIWHETYAVAARGGGEPLRHRPPVRPRRRGRRGARRAARGVGARAARRQGRLTCRQALARSSEAQAQTRESISWSPVAACTSQASARSSATGHRFSQVTRRSASRSNTSSHSAGAKTVTGVAARVRAAARRAAVGPPPTTIARRPGLGEAEQPGAVTGDALGGAEGHGATSSRGRTGCGRNLPVRCCIGARAM